MKPDFAATSRRTSMFGMIRACTLPMRASSARCLGGQGSYRVQKQTRVLAFSLTKPLGHRQAIRQPSSRENASAFSGSFQALDSWTLRFSVGRRREPRGR